MSPTPAPLPSARSRSPRRGSCRTAASTAFSSPFSGLVLLALVAGAGLGCAQSAPITPLPPPPQLQAPPPRPAELPDRPKEVIIEPGGEAGKRSLAEIAAEERQRRREGPASVARVDAETLDDYQDTPVTVAEKRAAGAGDGDGEALSEAERRAAEAVSEERYWRQRVYQIRLERHELRDEIEELDVRAAGLRRRFYAEDDPYVRDTRVKPAWDRTLDRLDEARTEHERLGRELDETLEEGRQAGALPGWLREGIDLEPGPDSSPPETPADPAEPTILEIGAEAEEPPR